MGSGLKLEAACCLLVFCSQVVNVNYFEGPFYMCLKKYRYEGSDSIEVPSTQNDKFLPVSVCCSIMHE